MGKLVKYQKNDIEVIKEAANFIKAGNIVCIPTETVYGISASSSNAQAVNRVFEIKKRDSSKALSILCRSISQVKRFAKFDDISLRLANKFMPGPLTLILPLIKPNSLADNISDNGNIGVRIADNEFVQHLLEFLDEPIIGTSVNLSGLPPAINVEMIDPEISQQLDLIIDGGPTSIGISSTIIDMTGLVPKIVRKGSITEEEINDIIYKKAGPSNS